MRACILNFRYWMDEPGDDVMWFYSENHALMFHTCQMLAGELYPSETFSNSGMTGLQMQQKAKGLLLEWFRGFLNEGFTEWNYLMAVSFLSMLPILLLFFCFQNYFIEGMNVGGAVK